jgi:alkylation response protein AidB-like acyl-CoA dehydrogenase
MMAAVASEPDAGDSEVPVERFAAEAHAWLRENAPPRPDEGTRWTELGAAKEFYRRLYDAGLIGIDFPRAYGGQGLTELHKRAFDEIAAKFDIPFFEFHVGIETCGPTILDLGTEEQKKRYVPPMLSGDEIWCQLFSEPSAGSDLAGLRTRAVRDGEGWRLTGQKVWTTGAHYSDYGLCLARTDPTLPKHRGISMFLLDMHAPGVDVRPLREVTGEAHFNEVFLDDVFVAGDQLLGEVNQGWNAAKLALAHERISVGGLTWFRPRAISVDGLRERVALSGRSGDVHVRRRLAELFVGEYAFDAVNERHKAESEAGIDIGSRGSIAKLAGSRQQDFGMEILNELVADGVVTWPAGGDDARTLAAELLETRKAGIAGGTDEIQLNQIGEVVLGLPREPRNDLDVPFNELRGG